MNLNDQARSVDSNVMMKYLTRPNEVNGKELDFISTLVRSVVTQSWYILIWHAIGNKTALVTYVDASFPAVALVENAENLERWGCCRKCDKTIRDFATIKDVVSHFELCKGE